MTAPEPTPVERTIAEAFYAEIGGQLMCQATLADAGRIPCQRTDPHEPHHGCLYTLTDQADAVHHDHQLEDQ